MPDVAIPQGFLAVFPIQPGDSHGPYGASE